MQTTHLGRWMAVMALAALSAFASSCVSNESGSERDATIETAGEGDGISGGSVYVDTVGPLPYEIFEQVVESEDPRKVTYQMMMLREGGFEAMSRTLRLALDSLSKADSSLVAARVTLFEVVPLDNMRGKLVARAWGEWIPREGWEGARSRRGAPHRSYIYHENPGWPTASRGQ